MARWVSAAEVGRAELGTGNVAAPNYIHFGPCSLFLRSQRGEKDLCVNNIATSCKDRVLGMTRCYQRLESRSSGYAVAHDEACGLQRQGRRVKQVFLGCSLQGCEPPSPPICYRSLSGPSGPKCPGSVPENGGVPGCLAQGVFGILRAPGTGMSKRCSECVPAASKQNISRTIHGDSQDTSGAGAPLRSPPSGLGDTSWDTLLNSPHLLSGPKGLSS